MKRKANVALVVKKAKEIEDKIAEFRRELHKNPELMYRENTTAEFIRKKLSKLDLNVENGIGNEKSIKKELSALNIDFKKDMSGTGIVGILKGENKGKTVALRADMDALPIKEPESKKHKPYAEGFSSRTPGVMHACGHDAHIAMLLGAAEILSSFKKQVCGTVKFIFQPAEEGGNGAKVMIEEGVIDDVDAIFGVHVWSPLEKNMVSVNSGVQMASCDKLKFSFEGGGGHASAPHETSDPISASLNFIDLLYKLHRSEIDARNPSVLTVTKIQSGNTWNVIPDRSIMEGTLRTFDADVRNKILSFVKRVGEHMADIHDLKFRFKDYKLSSPVINEKKAAKLAFKVSNDIFGKKRAIHEPPAMGAEDFGYYLEKIPGAFIFLGTKNKKKGIDAPHHNPWFDIDENILYKGAAFEATLALEYLKK